MNNKQLVSISPGNQKMGAIPSVSLPPITTCPKGVPCAKKCYAAKLCRIYPTVKKAYENNLNILNGNPIEYWRQVEKAVKMVKYFRFHVSGDIPDISYLAEMVLLAIRNPETQLLAFTKKFQLVNDFISDIGELPYNLHIIFSEWEGLTLPNPHNLPTATVIFKGEQPRKNVKICGGNCSECACQGVGCWELKRGETIAFYGH